MSVAGFFVIVGIMLAFATVLAPARRAWTRLPQDDLATRDLELGDPERERKRDHGRRVLRRKEPKLDRGMPYPDQYDIFGNPWKSKSLDSVAVPEPAYLPVSGGMSRGLGAADSYFEPQRGLDLPDPDVFNIPVEDGPDPFADPFEDPFADPTPEPPPVRPALISFQTLTSLAPRLFRWKAQALGDGEEEDKGNAAETEATPACTAATEKTLPTPAELAALSAAAARSAQTPPQEPFPEWLTTPKASAGPRAPRFFEVGLEDATCAPPDLDFVAVQHELLARVPISARPGVARGSTWHPGHGPIDEEEEDEPSRPAVVRNQTSAV